MGPGAVELSDSDDDDDIGPKPLAGTAGVHIHFENQHNFKFRISSIHACFHLYILNVHRARAYPSNPDLMVVAFYLAKVTPWLSTFSNKISFKK